MSTLISKNKKIVAMVPARLGSKRVKSKNLRFINGKPLISHVLSTLKDIEIFDSVYVNSDGMIFKEIAEEFGFNFYHRAENLADDEATNDQFAYDFLCNVECDYLVQVLPTSPFLLKTEVEKFSASLISRDLDCLISVVEKQIACVYKGQPINFRRDKVNPPSQQMTPVLAYATALMGWKRATFIRNYREGGVAYHGPNGTLDFFRLSGLSTIDIDNEEDFVLAEALMSAQDYLKKQPPIYYRNRGKH